MTHNHLVPGSSPGGTTNKPSKSLTMRVFVFNDLIVEPIVEPKSLICSMIYDSLIDKLNYLDEETSPKWGKMNSVQMINHCNNFIEVSLGNQKISLWTRLFGRLFGKVFLKYLKSLDFDINKYPKNSKTLKEFKPFSSEESFLNQKKRLIENIKMVKELKSHYTIHNIYGNIETSLFKKLVHFHTSYHFNQFGIL